MNILGINAYHGDASAAIVVDGQLVAAVEEERYNRIKHWAGFPAQSIRYCLETAGIDPREVDHVGISFNPCATLANGFCSSPKIDPRSKPLPTAFVGKGRRWPLKINLPRPLAFRVRNLRQSFIASSTTRHTWRPAF